MKKLQINFKKKYSVLQNSFDAQSRQFSFFFENIKDGNTSCESFLMLWKYNSGFKVRFIKILELKQLESDGIAAQTEDSDRFRH